MQCHSKTIGPTRPGSAFDILLPCKTTVVFGCPVSGSPLTIGQGPGRMQRTVRNPDCRRPQMVMVAGNRETVPHVHGFPTVEQPLGCSDALLQS
jgi:hypothetical protein